ncbi:MAG: prepilin-type N-terminal cleavage/methylation domain-containing protein [Candidatus Omnitrophica bacterium]|nr:prepilin-type N-terminal cleavage/methylation domain-containing protein [Candidatus Omnitrophota bacterium]
MTNKKNHGLTLVELLVATILIGIVMMGVVSFNYAIQQMQSTTNKSALLSMQSIGLLGQVTRDVSQAVGNSAANPGIITDSSHKTISVRQDLNNTPTDYSDDTWVTYTWDDPSHTLTRCEQTGTPIEGCAANHGTILSDKITNSTFWLKADQETSVFYVELSLTLKDNPNEAANPSLNPTTTITTRISPRGQSWTQ